MNLLARPLIVWTTALVATLAVGIDVIAPPGSAVISAVVGACASSLGAVSWPERRHLLMWPLGLCCAVMLLSGSAELNGGGSRGGAAIGDGRQRAVLAGCVERLVAQSPHGWTYDVEITGVDDHAFAGDRPMARVFVPHDHGFSGDDRAVGAPHRRRVVALPGDHVEVFARLERYPRRAFSAGRAPRRVMAGRGIDLRATALEPAEVESVEASAAQGVRRRLARGRVSFERRLLQALDGQKAALGVALTTGNRRFVDPATSDPFRHTGTAHLLAISGLHLGVLAALLWWLTGVAANRAPWLLARFGRRRVCGLGVVVMLGAYVVAIGAPVSAVRAWVAVAAAMGALVLLRPLCTIHALAAAAAGLALWQPSIVAELGFQLSFGATLGILLFLRHRPAALEPPEDVFGTPEARSRRWLRRVGLFVGVSTAATVSTWPVVAAHFGEVPAVGLLVNLVVTPLVSVVLFPVLAVGAIISAVVAPLGFGLMEVSLTGLLAVRDGLAWVATLPGAMWVPGLLPWWALAAMWLGAAGLVMSRWCPWRLAAALVALAIGFSPMLFASEAASRDELRVHFIPVGQGDATLVEFPDGATMLVDGGGSRWGRDPGRFVVVPYLSRMGIDRLDWVVVTHADTDHLGGLFAVVERMRPRRLVFDATDPTDELGRLRRRALIAGSRLHPIRRGIQIEQGGAGVEIVRAQLEGAARNQRSLVVRLDYEGAAVLLPGDVERAAERWLAAHRRLRAPVLKAPHHGSATSSSPAFLRAVDPQVAIVSAGRFSRFGHPHPSVVARYRHRAARVFETAHNGRVLVTVTPAGFIEVSAVRKGD